MTDIQARIAFIGTGIEGALTALEDGRPEQAKILMQSALRNCKRVIGEPIDKPTLAVREAK